MEPLVIASQILIALGIYNVWILRLQKATAWRGGSAISMREEFEVYGLPVWFMGVVGFLKVFLATMLIIAIWIPTLATPAATAMAVLMLGAIGMHFKVRDPLKRSLPAFTLLTLSLIVVFL